MKKEAFSYYSSKNSVAKKFIEEVGGVFVDIAEVTNSRREAGFSPPVWIGVFILFILLL